MNVYLKESERNRRLSLIKEFFLKTKKYIKYKDTYKGEPVGKWLCQIRSGNLFITDEERNELNTLGIRTFAIDADKIKEFEVDILIKFYKENNRLPYPNDMYIFNGNIEDINVRSYYLEKQDNYDLRTNNFCIRFNIGRFYVNVKNGHTKLSDDIINKLREAKINITPVISYEQREYTNVMNLVGFYKENRREPKYYECYGGTKVGSFLQRIRQNNDSISKDHLLLIKRYGIRISRR